MTYAEKLEAFRALFEKQNAERQARLFSNLTPDTVGVETGYKFDKVFVNTGAQRMGRYMVESRTGEIFGIKSWTQVNRRRHYGTLDTITQWDWSDFYARPLAGTNAERAHVERETEIKSTHKRRGRKPKSQMLKGKKA
jgi:hypothetical protein